MPAPTHFHSQTFGVAHSRAIGSGYAQYGSARPSQGQNAGTYSGRAIYKNKVVHIRSVGCIPAYISVYRLSGFLQSHRRGNKHQICVTGHRRLRLIFRTAASVKVLNIEKSRILNPEDEIQITQIKVGVYEQHALAHALQARGNIGAQGSLALTPPLPEATSMTLFMINQPPPSQAPCRRAFIMSYYKIRNNLNRLSEPEMKNNN